MLKRPAAPKVKAKPAVAPKVKAKPAVAPKVKAKPAKQMPVCPQERRVQEAITWGLNQEFIENATVFLGRALRANQLAAGKEAEINLLQNGNGTFEVQNLPSAKYIYEFKIGWFRVEHDSECMLHGSVVRQRRLCTLKMFWEVACKMGLNQGQIHAIREMISGNASSDDDGHEAEHEAEYQL